MVRIVRDQVFGVGASVNGVFHVRFRRWSFHVWLKHVAAVAVYPMGWGWPRARWIDRYNANYQATCGPVYVCSSLWPLRPLMRWRWRRQFPEVGR